MSLSCCTLSIVRASNINFVLKLAAGSAFLLMSCCIISKHQWVPVSITVGIQQIQQNWDCEPIQMQATFCSQAFYARWLSRLIGNWPHSINIRSSASIQINNLSVRYASAQADNYTAPVQQLHWLSLVVTKITYWRNYARMYTEIHNLIIAPIVLTWSGISKEPDVVMTCFKLVPVIQQHRERCLSESRCWGQFNYLSSG